MAKPRVIIIGGGFAGLNVAKSLKNADVDIILIDKTNHHLFQPLLYQVATALLSAPDISSPIREVLAKQKNAHVIMGLVDTISTEQKIVFLKNGQEIAYDYLVVATGARHSYFGHQEWEKFAPGLKTVQDALAIRDNILSSFEKAERMDNLSEATPYLNFVVIGGGPTGVEMAGAIAEIAYKTMFCNFRKISPEKSKIYLLEALPNILPMYSTALANRAKKDLEKLGVIVQTGTKVTNITKDGVELEHGFIPSHNIIWAAGNEAGAVLKTLGVPLDRQGRVIVEADLSIPGHREVFVIGDAAHTKGKNDMPLPGIAPVALQQGKYIGKLLAKMPKERKPFAYFDKGSMATIGKFKAIAKVGKLEITGFLAWLAWGLIHILYLIDFRNRIAVFLGWIVAIFTGKRGARLIYRCIEDDISSPKDG